MSTYPDESTMLAAAATFVHRELRPAVEDPALKFRALIAADIIARCAALAKVGPALDSGEASALQSFINADGDVDAARTALCKAIRAGELDERSDEVRGTLLRTTGMLLAATNPRFDRGMNID